MQTVNFQCGNCNRLMAVGAEHLGQQVRCPHCQAVVVAPAAVPQPAPAPAPASAGPTETLSFAPPQFGDHEDIFSPPPPSDDLFGEPEAPRLEMPPAPTAPPDGPAPPPVMNEPLGPTQVLPGLQPFPPPPAEDATIPSWVRAPAPEPSPVPPPAATDQAPAADPEHAEAPPAYVRKPRDRGGWFMGLVFIPLVSYAILVTILAAYLFEVNQQNQQQAAPQSNPLENLPSFDPNDAEHSTHLKLDANKINLVRGLDLAKATTPLPDYLITPLGKPLRVGDLEVTPETVSRRVVSVDVQGYAKPEPCQYPSLVLRLKLRNVSGNVVFQPMDAYFDRFWDRKKGGQPPLTILEAPQDDHKTYIVGGPARYPPPPRGAAEGDNPREWVHGSNVDRVLNPGEEMEGLVCTDGNDKESADAIEAHRGPLLWRVHLRRGILVLNEHRYAPVSSVVGVAFSDEDYRKSS